MRILACLMVLAFPVGCNEANSSKKPDDTRPKNTSQPTPPLTKQNIPKPLSDSGRTQAVTLASSLPIVRADQAEAPHVSILVVRLPGASERIELPVRSTLTGPLVRIEGTPGGNAAKDDEYMSIMLSNNAAPRTEVVLTLDRRPKGPGTVRVTFASFRRNGTRAGGRANGTLLVTAVGREERTSDGHELTWNLPLSGEVEVLTDDGLLVTGDIEVLGL